MRTVICTLSLLIGSFALSFTQTMDNEKLGKIFYVLSDSLNGQDGQWELWIGEMPMLCLTDEKHNRMRIISPVKEVKDASETEIRKCMEANFHTALDVKYAISDGIIWVAFIHPLAELSKGQVVDALAQVRAATLTYGTLYTSTELVFPKKGEEKSVNKEQKSRL